MTGETGCPRSPYGYYCIEVDAKVICGAECFKPEFKGKIVKRINGSHDLIVFPTGKPPESDIMARLEVI